MVASHTLLVWTSERGYISFVRWPTSANFPIFVCRFSCESIFVFSFFSRFDFRFSLLMQFNFHSSFFLRFDSLLVQFYFRSPPILLFMRFYLHALRFSLRAVGVAQLSACPVGVLPCVLINTYLGPRGQQQNRWRPKSKLQEQRKSRIKTQEKRRTKIELHEQRKLEIEMQEEWKSKNNPHEKRQTKMRKLALVGHHTLVLLPLRMIHYRRIIIATGDSQM